MEGGCDRWSNAREEEERGGHDNAMGDEIGGGGGGEGQYEVESVGKRGKRAEISFLIRSVVLGETFILRGAFSSMCNR